MIYTQKLQYEVQPSGKRILEYPSKTVVPKYAVVGNTKPNLDYQTNRMLQPIFQTKQPLQQTPYQPTQPIKSTGLGGRQPISIDYVVVPRKPRPAMGLIWEPNTYREIRQNVYPDGVPKNNLPSQSADSTYLEQLNNERKQRDLEEQLGKFNNGRPYTGIRPHPTREAELKRLEDMLAEAKYGRAYKNVGLNAEQHRIMAERQAREIRDELDALRGETKDNARELKTELLRASLGASLGGAPAKGGIKKSVSGSSTPPSPPSGAPVKPARRGSAGALSVPSSSSLGGIPFAPVKSSPPASPPAPASPKAGGIKKVGAFPPPAGGKKNP